MSEKHLRGDRTTATFGVRLPTLANLLKLDRLMSFAFGVARSLYPSTIFSTIAISEARVIPITEAC